MYKITNLFKKVSFNINTCTIYIIEKLFFFMTTENFIEKAIIIHNNKYQYINTKYISSSKKVDIFCPKHGMFQQTPYNHLQGKNCKFCGYDIIKQKKLNTTENFINKAKNIHLEKYDYSKTNYISAHCKIIIICKNHGEFLQTPNSHLNGSGCIKCRYNNNKKLSNTSSFIKKALKIHGDKYDYSNVNYLSAKEDVEIICKLHGNFSQKANSHLNGNGCNKCGIKNAADLQRKSSEQFITEACKIHNNKYNYSLVDYKSARKKVKIICPVHGIFEQLTGSHISGKGCSQCGFDLCNFKKGSWIKKAKGREGIFYIINCYNDNENFYKFGITFKSVKLRYPSKNSMPYDYKIIKEIKSKDLSYIWDLEKRFKRVKNKNHYKPLIPFLGSKYECFL